MESDSQKEPRASTEKAQNIQVLKAQRNFI